MNEQHGNYTSNISTIDSLYGPGTMIGWYLTLLGCVVSWTYHPERSRRDSIDADLVVAFMLPVVAVIHLVSLARRVPSRPDVAQINIERLAEVIEAPLIVTETFMSIAIWMFLIAAVAFKLKRAVVTAVVGLLCYAAIWYLHVGKVKQSGLLWRLQGPSVANSSLALLGSAVALALLCAGASVLTALFFMRRSRQNSTVPESGSQSIPTSGPEQLFHRRDSIEIASLHNDISVLEAEMTASSIQQMDELNGNMKKSLRSSTMLSTLFLPLSFLLSLYGVSYGQNAPPSWFEAAVHPQVGLGTLVRFFPSSPATMRDSDQIVAALSGAIVFLFDLFSAARTRYQQKQEAEGREADVRQRNEERMRRLLLRYGEARQMLSEASAVEQRNI